MESVNDLPACPALCVVVPLWIQRRPELQDTVERRNVMAELNFLNRQWIGFQLEVADDFLFRTRNWPLTHRATFLFNYLVTQGIKLIDPSLQLTLAIRQLRPQGNGFSRAIDYGLFLGAGRISAEILPHRLIQLTVELELF